MLLEKVTAFILREGREVRQLLIFRHPTAGYQLPAGTVESGETPEVAAAREVGEETGLVVRGVRKLGHAERPTPPGSSALRSRWTVLYREPRRGSARAGEPIPRAVVQVGERKAGFVFIRYEERDLNRTPAALLWEASGWVPESELADATRRHFFQVEVAPDARESWEQPDESGHTFRVFWAPLDHLPGLIGPQQAWLDWLVKIPGLH